MSGTIFSICATLPISALPAALKRCRKGYRKKGQERIVAKSKPTLKLVSRSAASSPAAPSSSVSNRPGILRAPSKQGSNLTTKGAGKLAAGGSNQNYAASSSQVWLTDAKTNDITRKLAAAGTNHDQSFQQRTRKFAAEKSEINDEDTEWPHSYRMSRANVPHLEFATTTQTQTRRQNGRHRCGYVDMGNVCDCHSASRNSSSTSCMSKTQTSVSHSSTESKIISRNAGLRMDGIPALDLWDVVIEV